MKVFLTDSNHKTFMLSCGQEQYPTPAVPVSKYLYLILNMYYFIEVTGQWAFKITNRAVEPKIIF